MSKSITVDHSPVTTHADSLTAGKAAHRHGPATAHIAEPAEPRGS